MPRYRDNSMRTVSRWQQATAGAVVALSVACFSTTFAWGEDSDSTSSAASEQADAVKQGRHALDSWNDYPWYDTEQDGLRRIGVKKVKEKTTAPPTRSPGARSEGAASTLAFIAIWILLPLLAVAIIYFLVRAYYDTDAPEAVESEEVAFDIDRVEALPTKIRVPTSGLLAEAERCYQQGNYRQAIICLYSHQLLQLDKKQLIRLTKGKTNRQYLREVGSRRSIRELFEPTMRTFEDVFFGGQTLTRGSFELCWQRQGPFDAQVEGATI